MELVMPYSMQHKTSQNVGCNGFDKWHSSVSVPRTRMEKMMIMISPKSGSLWGHMQSRSGPSYWTENQSQPEVESPWFSLAG
eukprot:1176747-Amphidinium_carterae.3